MAKLKLTGVGTQAGPASAPGAAPLLRDINLEVAPGELVVLLGPTGSGKSTLLRMIAGLEPTPEGRIEIDGIPVNDLHPSRRGVAMVSQEHALYPHMTIYDNLAFALSVAGKSRAEIDEAVRKSARALQLEPLLEKRPDALSPGQRQRVAIGRALVRDPKLYLLDDPLSRLDAASRIATRIEIARLKERMPDATMLYVTHDQDEAMTLADRIVLLAEGTVAQAGPPMELYDNPASEFVARFIGTPPMNLLPGTITGTGRQTRVALDQGGAVIADLATTDADQGNPVSVGIRPEDFTLAAASDGSAISRLVTHVEALGDATLAYLSDNGIRDACIAKLPRGTRVVRGTNLRLQADPARIHLFHQGQAMRPDA